MGHCWWLVDGVFVPDLYTGVYRLQVYKNARYTIRGKSGINVTSKVFSEPSRDKNNKMVCAPSEGSDQPGQPPSLIRVGAVRMEKAWVLSYPLSAQRRL